MNCKTQVGLALAGGYLLGRTKRMKLALMIGGMAAGRKLSTNPGELLGKGADMLRSNEQVDALVEQARTGLLQAGKAAAIAAATGKMESMSNRLADRASALGPLDASADEEEEEEEPEEEPEGAQADSSEEADEEPEEEEEEEEEPEEVEEEKKDAPKKTAKKTAKPAQRRRRPAAKSQSSSSSRSTSSASKSAPQRRRKPARASSGSK